MPHSSRWVLDDLLNLSVRLIGVFKSVNAMATTLLGVLEGKILSTPCVISFFAEPDG